jgi:hypothetical protein
LDDSSFCADEDVFEDECTTCEDECHMCVECEICDEWPLCESEECVVCEWEECALCESEECDDCDIIAIYAKNAHYVNAHLQIAV